MSVTFADLHFQCSFEIIPANNQVDPWNDLVRSIRHWISTSPSKSPPVTNEAFGRAWFFKGGSWNGFGDAFYKVSTARAKGDGTDQEPQHWAVCYEHDCEVEGRKWKIDIGVTRTSERTYRFSLATSHYMRGGFIGHYPKPPLPTAPRIVKWFLDSREWEVYGGSERLYGSYSRLEIGEGRDFKSRIENQKREVPILLVSLDNQTGFPLIDIERLSHLVGGSASVYETASATVSEEIDACLGSRFGCWNGMVRLYLPKIGIVTNRDAGRHRYFSGRSIKESGADAVMEALVRGIVRRADQPAIGFVRSIEDVASFDRTRHFLELKSQPKRDNQDEWVKLLEERDTELQKQLNEKLEEIQGLKSNLEDSEDRATKLEFEKKAAYHKLGAASHISASAQNLADLISTMSSLPQTIKDAAKLIEKIHSGRIAFTVQAYESMDDCDFPNISDAWACFWAMATHLHDIIFSNNGGELEDIFHERTGFYLAMTEGSLTKSDNKLMNKRDDSFEGKPIKIVPHVRLDKDTTRAYFADFREEKRKLIVVGFVGHLDTAGTKRRKN